MAENSTEKGSNKWRLSLKKNPDRFKFTSSSKHVDDYKHKYMCMCQKILNELLTGPLRHSQIGLKHEIRMKRHTFNRLFKHKAKSKRVV